MHYELLDQRLSHYHSANLQKPVLSIVGTQTVCQIKQAYRCQNDQLIDHKLFAPYNKLKAASITNCWFRDCPLVQTTACLLQKPGLSTVGPQTVSPIKQTQSSQGYQLLGQRLSHNAKLLKPALSPVGPFPQCKLTEASTINCWSRSHDYQLLEHRLSTPLKKQKTLTITRLPTVYVDNFL